MSKRIKIIIESRESKTLKALRIKSDLSIRKVADRMDLSKTRVSQMESGRDNVSEEYVLQFIKAINISHETWRFELAKRDFNKDLRDKCFDLISSLDSCQLTKIYNILLSI